jgi:O-antigen/teichoic acid export membrane protein
MIVWSVAGTVLHQLDRVLIGIVLPVAALTPYEIGARLAVYSRTLLHSWLGVVMPATAALAARGERRRTRGLYLRGTRYLLATYAGVAAVLIGLGGPLVRLWMGPGFDESARILALLVLGSLFQSQNLVAHVMLPGLGEFAVFTRFMALYPIVTAGCAVTGILTGGLIGLAAGMSVAIAAMELLFATTIVRPVLGVPMATVLRRCHVPVVRAMAPVVAWIACVRLGPGVDSWSALLATLAVAGLLFTLGAWWSVLTAGERRALGRRLARLRRLPATPALHTEAPC